MGALELKEKLIKQFEIIIEDDTKLIILDGVFDAMIATTDTNSNVSDKQYAIIEERRKKRMAGKTESKSWDNLKNELKYKYGC
ncbi:hypothetical protein EZY14_017575 [Kordia sp. TARA_039_SRF]|nr:hypothetical protein EZY14_017575 [Kordia sp. TARA_039_SRF]